MSTQIFRLLLEAPKCNLVDTAGDCWRELKLAPGNSIPGASQRWLCTRDLRERKGHCADTMSTFARHGATDFRPRWASDKDDDTYETPAD